MDNLLKFLFRAAGVEPKYDEGLCLAAGRTTSCTVCRDVCPHDAITIRGAVRGRVEIDGVDCSGCGLCVQACPTQALEPKVSFTPGSVLKCSRVSGSAQTVHCLGRLQPSDLLRLAGSKARVSIGRGDCSTCPIGGSGVAEALDEVRADALRLAELHGRELGIDIAEVDQLDDDARSDVLSRRELLRGGWRSLQERAGEALAPLDPGPAAGDRDHGLPGEMRRRYRTIAAARPEPAQLVPWVLPRIGDSCIMCPACTKACPTGALERVFEPGGDGTLRLQPDRCMACEACVSVCPVDAISMDASVSWAELSGGSEVAYRRDPQREHPGSIAR